MKTFERNNRNIFVFEKEDKENWVVINEVSPCHVAKERGVGMAEALYLPVNLLCKAINAALERTKKSDLCINAPTFKADLKACGFGKFCLSCMPLADSCKCAMTYWKKGSDDATIVHARLDAMGRPCYSVKEALQGFYAKFADEIAASRAERKNLQKSEKEVLRLKKAYKHATEEQIRAIVCA